MKPEFVGAAFSDDAAPVPGRVLVMVAFLLLLPWSLLSRATRFRSPASVSPFFETEGGLLTTDEWCFVRVWLTLLATPVFSRTVSV